MFSLSLGTLTSVSAVAESLPSRLVIAIDGPSGSGKSSTARGVAQALGLDFLDTGAMYRACTWLVQASAIPITDQERVAALVASADLHMCANPDRPTIAVNGVDVTETIRDPEVSAAVSLVATNLAVRADLIRRQRAIIDRSVRGIVAEGRDITTVVAPDADVRVLLVADPAARVSRRHAELGDANVDTATVTDQVIRRDRDDSTVAQFEAAAPGVSVVDSTHLDLSEVVAKICALAEPYVAETSSRQDRR